MRPRLLLVLLTSLVGGLVVPQQAAALTCAISPDGGERKFMESTAAIVGELLEVEPIGPEPPRGIGYLSGQSVRFHFRVLEVHKGRRLLVPGQEVSPVGIHYGAFGTPPQPLPGPFAVMLNRRGSDDWATGFMGLCEPGLTIERLRELGALYPERDRYLPEPRPPVCLCGPGRPPFSLAGRTEYRLRHALARGIKLRVSCRVSCRFVARLELRASTARKLMQSKAGAAVTVARAEASIDRGGRSYVVVRFTRQAKRRLKHAGSLKLRLRTRFEGGGRALTSRRTVTLSV